MKNLKELKEINLEEVLKLKQLTVVELAKKYGVHRHTLRKVAERYWDKYLEVKTGFDVGLPWLKKVRVLHVDRMSDEEREEFYRQLADYAVQRYALGRLKNLEGIPEDRIVRLNIFEWNEVKDTLMRVSDVVRKYGFTRQRIWQLIHKGDIPVWVVNGVLFIDKEEFIRSFLPEFAKRTTKTKVKLAAMKNAD